MKKNISTFVVALNWILPLLLVMAIMVITMTGCSDADVASQRVSRDADMFRVMRRIVFYNGITDRYILVVEGLCSLGNYDVDGELSVTCKTGPNSFKKHFLGLSDNVTYFAEQLEPIEEDVYHYKVIFKPSVIIPDVEIPIK